MVPRVLGRCHHTSFEKTVFLHVANTLVWPGISIDSGPWIVRLDRLHFVQICCCVKIRVPFITRLRPTVADVNSSWAVTVPVEARRSAMTESHSSHVRAALDSFT